jgi:hypothetical protein
MLSESSFFPLRTDGLYREGPRYDSEVQQGFCHYLRFYADGMALRTVSTGTPEEVIEWLNPDHLDFRGGLWLRNGSHLFCETSCSQGTVEYEGTIAENALVLDIRSHINGYRTSGLVFRFAHVK